MNFVSKNINNVRGMTKKVSHNHGQPRNLQHNTLIIKEKFNTIQPHTHTRKTKLKPTSGGGGGGRGS